MNKTLRVIDSCKTMDQLTSAENYANLYLKKYNSENNKVRVAYELLTKFKQLIKTK